MGKNWGEVLPIGTLLQLAKHQVWGQSDRTVVKAFALPTQVQS